MSDLRAAKERIENAAPGSGYFFSFGGIGGRYLDDLKALARAHIAYLATHAADDETPIDAEWFRREFHPTDNGIAGLSILLPPNKYIPNGAPAELYLMCNEPDALGWSVSISQGVPDDASYKDDHVTLTSLPEQLTRGQLRRLIAALGGR